MERKAIENVGQLRELIKDLEDKTPLVFWSSGVFHQLGEVMGLDDCYLIGGDQPGNILTTAHMVAKDKTLQGMKARDAKRRKKKFEKLGQALVIG